MQLGGTSHHLAIKRLLPRHVEIMERLMTGQKQCEIARDMGMTGGRISIIINSPLFQLEFKKKLMLREKRVIEIQTNILEAAVTGSKLERDVLEDQSLPLGIKLKVAQEVNQRALRLMEMGRERATPIQEVDGGGGSYEERLRKVTFEEKVTTVTPKTDLEGEEGGTGSQIDPDEIEKLLEEGRPSEEELREVGEEEEQL